MKQRQWLLLDHHRDVQDYGAPSWQAFLKRWEGVTWTIRRPPDEDFPSLGPQAPWDAVILSGSKTSIFSQEPWVLSLEAWVFEWMSTGRPLLGVCFGHQLIARVLFGVAVLRAMPQPCLQQKVLIQGVPHPLWSGREGQFLAYAHHREEVCELPTGTCQVLASSSFCAIEAFQVIGKPWYGVQFHPEKSPHFEEPRNFLAEGLQSILNPSF